MKYHKDDIEFELYTHKNYRGVGKFSFKKEFEIPAEKMDEIESYDYKTDFKNYLSLIVLNPLDN